MLCIVIYDVCLVCIIIIIRYIMCVRALQINTFALLLF